MLRKIILQYKKYFIILVASLVLALILPLLIFKNADFLSSSDALALSFSGPQREAIGGKILSPYKISFKNMLRMGFAPELISAPKFIIQEYKGPQTMVIIVSGVLGKCWPGNGIGGKGYWGSGRLKGFFFMTKGACGKTSTL